MNTVKQSEKKMLDQAMTLLVKVQLGNENKKVKNTLDAITNDIDDLIHEEYNNIS